MTRPNTSNLILTRKVAEKFMFDGTSLLDLVIKEWENQPDQDSEGGNDKRFFSINISEKGEFNLWVVYTDYTIANEENPKEYPLRETYTVMFPDEY